MKKRDIDPGSYSHLPYTKRWMSLDKEIANKELWKGALKEPLVIVAIIAVAMTIILLRNYITLALSVIPILLMWVSFIKRKNYLKAFEYIEKQKNTVTGNELYLIHRTRYHMDNEVKNSFIEVNDAFNRKEDAEAALEGCSKHRLEFFGVLYEKTIKI